MNRSGSFVAMLAIAVAATAAAPEFNPVHPHLIAIGPETSRLIVGLRAVSSDARIQAQTLATTQSNAVQIDALSTRVGLHVARSRQIAPHMHVLHLQQTLRGVEVGAALARLRADPAVEFAEVDERRFAHAANPPNDPLYLPSANATGQWYMQNTQPAAVDAVDAWGVTTGSTGTVIADLDTGIRFDHPDLQRAGLGGRVLPGYDFVGQDFNSTNSAALGTFLTANDGDGWDPDPSDPGDWITTADTSNPVFSGSCTTASDSSWHGVRVSGILGALTNNGVGIAGMTWQSWLLPVRVLGKCGGYDSDILTGMQWAAGISVQGVPDNAYPANIINMSLGGAATCPTSYQTIVNSIVAKHILIVASAGNGGANVETPANCNGVLAVAGLRHIGSKVGYSSFGTEVAIAAPAGNCVNTSVNQPCLFSIDTSTNLGTTTPGASAYTDQFNDNLGTSFSAPIVAGIAALMHAVNANLSPADLIERMRLGAKPFPTSPDPTVPTCPSVSSSGECNCTTTTCGAGMANALGAVNQALRPIAAVRLPASVNAGTNATFDASGSAAACSHLVAAYAWSVLPPGNPASIVSATNTASVTVTPPASASFVLHVVVTDDQGLTDAADVTVTPTSASTVVAASAGTTACPVAINVTPSAPTVAEAFTPASFVTSGTSTLTLTFSNANPFALTATALTDTLPGGVSVAMTAGASTTCPGGQVTTTSGGLSLSGAIIPARGSCTAQVNVTSGTAGSYQNTVGVGALTTGPAGANTSAANATLDVTAATSGGGGGTTASKSGGGGALDGLTLAGVALLLLARLAYADRSGRPGRLRRIAARHARRTSSARLEVGVAVELALIEAPQRLTLGDRHAALADRSLAVTRERRV
jgi:serine protease